MEPNEQNVNRRDFLKAVAVTAVAATATGGGAAIIANRTTTPPAPTIPLSAPIAPASAASSMSATTNNSQQLAQLAQVQAENMRLQAALDAANRQLESLQTDSDTAQQLQVQLGQATEQASLLAGLVTLYEQLEDVDVETVVNNGLVAVSGTMLDLIDQLPTLEESIAMGHDVLDTLEEQIPTVVNGRIWLNNRLSLLASAYDNIEDLLQQTASAVKPVLDMVNDWVQDILKWLPFNLGQRTSNIMTAITDLLSQTPTTINGLQQNLASPLAVWLGDDANADTTPLQQNLVKPIRERLILDAGETTGKAHTLRAIYDQDLAEPIQTAVADRQALAAAIAEYRQQHQI